MVFSMATTKITITLQDDQLEAIRALAAPGSLQRVSRVILQIAPDTSGLEGHDGNTMGQLIGGGGRADVVDAQVGGCALWRKHAIVTSVPDDPRRTAPTGIFVAV